MKITFTAKELKECCRVLKDWYSVEITPKQLTKLIPAYKLAYLIGDGVSDTVNRERLIDWLCQAMDVWEDWPVNGDDDQSAKSFYKKFKAATKAHGLVFG